MAVERPIADRISGKITSHLTARLDDYRMFARSVITMAGDEFEEMAVDVDRMAHHGVIDKVHANPPALNDGVGFMHVGHLLSVKRPHEQFHVRGPLYVHSAARQ